MANITNATLWNAVRKTFPNFASQTSEATADFFTERGFEQLQSNWRSTSILNDFFNLSMRVWLNVINTARAVDTLEEQGFGEYFDQPWGAYILRYAIDSVKPISPKYKNLANGQTVDPYVVRKPSVEERVFAQNFDFQSLLTIPDDFQMKTIFVNEYGMDTYMNGLMEALENGYKIQKYVNKLEALNKGINSTAHPMQDTQKVVSALSGTPTDTELKAFLVAVRNVVSAMTIAPTTNAFNAMYFASHQSKDRLKLLVRPAIKTALDVYTMSGAFNPEYLNLGVDIVEVPNFGGLVPYKEQAFTTRLYPVYDSMGTEIGYNTTEGASVVTVEADEVFWKDTNEKVNALLADKGYLFECKQNPYTVEPIRNPLGKYTNYIASCPNSTVAVDHLYNVVEFLNS